MADKPRNDQEKIPLLLLKTKSTPTDAYDEYFTALDDGKYEPVFVPVLEHSFKQDALNQVQQHIEKGDFAGVHPGGRPKYGAIIFTSQRAVEAFAQIVENVRNRKDSHLLEALLPKHMPLYVVGPATARSLKSINLHCPIVGEETGNGQALAKFILDHYNELYEGDDKPHVLFLVGEKRRDVIPKTLQSPDLPTGQRLVVQELEIYETGEMQSFKSNFTSIWQNNAVLGKMRQWVVVFSPTGCQAMLESLGLLSPGPGKSTASSATPRDVSIVTIGPTTRDYLIEEFGFTPEVCAPRPSAEGIAEGMQSFLSRSG
ncbi:uroporphyrinogen-III synthase [Didymosphaeria variabile]|uniref:Uroporphyrinogen-III synthase n=1 Tax=Didymosphaeria variabile TaxID=1932322 RepID=A0A9W9C715_9PLEO|nr:uroporphyrinogen-III synthase [Didymosphaeria variabile]KAJ4347003.1 uroporphyrinogen-III synthase [Didymosphaeria variabile]